MKQLLLSIFVLSLLALGAPNVSAQSEYFTLEVYLSSADEDVNAFETTLALPNSWVVEDLILKDSDLIYWIETPEKNIEGDMNFSGIFPGGVQNLKNYSTPLLLFSLNVRGEFELVEGTEFLNTHIYLNHPMAIEAERSEFLFKIHAGKEALLLNDISALDDLDYSFTTDPVSGETSLVINSYRGALAAYIFEVKEGDLWTADWFRINGVSALSANNSTVSLFVTAPDGDQEKLVLRTSILHTGFVAMAVLLCLCLVAYLFFLSLRILPFTPSVRRPRDLTKLK